MRCGLFIDIVQAPHQTTSQPCTAAERVWHRLRAMPVELLFFRRRGAVRSVRSTSSITSGAVRVRSCSGVRERGVCVRCGTRLLSTDSWECRLARKSQAGTSTTRVACLPGVASKIVPGTKIDFKTLLHLPTGDDLCLLCSQASGNVKRNSVFGLFRNETSLLAHLPSQSHVAVPPPLFVFPTNRRTRGFRTRAQPTPRFPRWKQRWRVWRGRRGRAASPPAWPPR